MTKLFRKMKAASANAVMSASKYIEKNGSHLVVMGFEYVTNKEGKSQPTFITEKGSFFATDWQKKNLLPVLTTEYGTAEEIDAALRRNPQVWIMEKVSTQKGTPWVRTVIVEELEGEMEDDGRNDTSPGTERGNGTGDGKTQAVNICAE